MNWIFAISLAFAEPSSESTDTGSSEPASENTDTGETESTDTSTPEDTSEPSSEPSSDTSQPSSEPSSEDTSDTSSPNDTAIIFESAADMAKEEGGFGCSTIQMGGLAFFWIAALFASFRREA
jgi:hypothetical protein